MILDDLVASTRRALAARRQAIPEAALRGSLAHLPPAFDMAARLRRSPVGRVPSPDGTTAPSAHRAGGLAIIAEVKRASPSRGALNAALDPGGLALAYARVGAAAISVLTEESRFCGSLADLAAARDAVRSAGFDTPLLRKDFIVDSYQLLEARVHGADAALLIAAVLSDDELGHLLDEALCLGLTPLVEVHDEAELGRVLPLKPPVIGINNRNLADFTVDLEATRRLRPLIPPGIIVVSESGIGTPAQVAEMARLGVDAALVGEALVTAPDPAARLATLLEAKPWPEHP